MGCHEQAADLWRLKDQQMYWRNVAIALSGPSVRHFCLYSDPGKHSYKECLVSVLWCWENMQAMHCPWQHLVEGKVITPLEAHMDDQMVGFAARQKLERVASYRQLQGYSNQLRAMTQCRQPPVTLKTVALPSDFCVRHVNANEARKTVRGELCL